MGNSSNSNSDNILTTIKALIDFIFKLLSFFKSSEDTEKND